MTHETIERIKTGLMCSNKDYIERRSIRESMYKVGYKVTKEPSGSMFMFELKEDTSLDFLCTH